MVNSPVEKLFHLGTSVWYDNISRDLLESGELKRLVKDWSLRGLTSNPSIFEKSIRSSSTYDQQIKKAEQDGLSTSDIFEELALADIREAAQLLRPVYEESEGLDGYVSIEVSPLLAADTKGTISEGKKLFSRLNLPNIMIKVPGTPQGIPAVQALLEEGINVNVTLLFSVENYAQVATAYIKALQARHARGLAINNIASVASFFVSRVDTVVDAALESIVKENGENAARALALRGIAGIANSRLAYQRFLQIFGSSEFAALTKAGARKQRPLWASTSTKNPNYRDVIYVEELIGAETVNTVPHDTLGAFVDHGNPARQTLLDNLSQAESLTQDLSGLGIDLNGILTELQIDGVKKFSQSFVSLIEAIELKLKARQ